MMMMMMYVRVYMDRSIAVYTRAERVGASDGGTVDRANSGYNVGGRIQGTHLHAYHHELRQRGISISIIIIIN